MKVVGQIVCFLILGSVFVWDLIGSVKSDDFLNFSITGALFLVLLGLCLFTFLGGC